MALSADRNTQERSGVELVLPVAASTIVYAGALVVMASGYAKGGVTATGLVAMGRAEEQVDNSAGDNGDKTVRVKRGCFPFANSGGGDLIAKANIGSVCFIVDDQTVAKTSNSNARSRAGMIVDVDQFGVWVLVGPGIVSDGATSLAAAGNLSDVVDAPTSRANIGANKVVVTVPELAALDGTGVVRVVSPVAGTITKIWSVTSGALSTGNATLTGKIGATAITNGVITIAESGSAAGDVDSATPSAANVVAAGEVINFTVGGTNDATEFASISLLIET